MEQPDCCHSGQIQETCRSASWVQLYPNPEHGQVYALERKDCVHNGWSAWSACTPSCTHHSKLVAGSNWRKCATTNQYCSFSGKGMFKYGFPGYKWETKVNVFGLFSFKIKWLLFYDEQIINFIALYIKPHNPSILKTDSMLIYLF